MTIATGKLLAGSILDEEITLERSATQAGVARYRRLAHEAVMRGEGAALKPAERMLLHWHKPLAAAIREEKRACIRGDAAQGRDQYRQAIQLLSADRMAVATIRQTLSACMAEPDGVPFSKLVYAVGRDVIAELYLDDLKKEPGRKNLHDLDRRIRNVRPGHVNWWARKTLDDPQWELKVCAYLGTRLVWFLVGTASTADYAEAFRLAFHHVKRPVKGKTKAFIRMDPRVFDLIAEGHSWRMHMRPRYLPMIVEPYPWQPDAQGGYVQIRTPFISKPTRGQKAALKEADLTQVYDCLNAVNGQAWRINGRVLDVMRHVWETGGGTLGIPHANDHPLPPRPLDIDRDAEVKKQWKAEASQVHRKNIHLRSERIEFIQRLDVAERMAKRDQCFFPHQLDFRGRMYPIPPYLNHQGDDVCRGLLQFATPRGSDGETERYWLAVHAANCWGLDKASFAERSQWTREAFGEMSIAAAHPMETVKWWSQAEKPWQFLAACMAITYGGEYLPVQVDGTCNGLQHYAAMGRDRKGAAAVNLLPADRPADVYGDVALIVGRMVEEDARLGVPEAMIVSGHIDRAMVKQPVMTSVYGVTAAGARAQVLENLKKLGLEDDALYKAAAYLSRVTLNAIGEVCESATAIMDWLRQAARKVTETGEPVRWTTPLGLPVVQPYRKWSTVTIKTIAQQVTLPSKDERVPVKRGKQADGFAPNFVHSIDATHMMMTARACRQAGIAFAAVHDSYWTHAADMDRLARILREQFVELHRENLLAKLKIELEERYEIDLPPLPPTGDLAIEEVMGSDYFFS